MWKWYFILITNNYNIAVNFDYCLLLDIALPPPVSLKQNVSSSVPTSVPEEETGNTVLPLETQEQITHSVVLANEVEEEQIMLS